MPVQVVIFSKPLCPYCAAAKSLLHEKGVAYREIDVSRNAAARDEMIRRSGRVTVPQIFINDRHVGGFDDLSQLDQQGELDPLLHIRP